MHTGTAHTHDVDPVDVFGTRSRLFGHITVVTTHIHPCGDSQGRQRALLRALAKGLCLIVCRTVTWSRAPVGGPQPESHRQRWQVVVSSADPSILSGWLVCDDNTRLTEALGSTTLLGLGVEA